MSSTTSGLENGLNLLAAADMSAPMKYKYVVMNLNNQFTSSMCKLFTQLGEMKERSGDYKVEVYQDGIEWPFATISKRDASNVNLILTLAQKNAQLQAGDTVRSKSLVQAKVVSCVEGKLTIKPYSTSAFTSADFAVGEIVGFNGHHTPLDGGDSIQRRVYMPTSTYNIIQQLRVTAEIQANEAWRETFLYNSQGRPYYFTDTQQNKLGELMTTVCKNLYTGERIEDTQSPQSGGVLWQLKNQGGTYRAFYSTSGFETELENLSLDINQQGVIPSGTFYGLAGYGYRAIFGKAFKEYVVTAGVNNVVGDKDVTGLDITTYATPGGYKYKMEKENFRDSKALFGEEGYSTINNSLKSSNTCVFFDPGQVRTNGGTAPAVMNYYYGSAGLITGETPGLTNMQGVESKRGTNGRLASKEDYHLSGMYQLMQPARHAYHYLAV
jgi:hypothetical protein